MSRLAALINVARQAATWWLILFGALTVALIAAAFLVPFRYWAPAVFASWLPLELFGVVKNDPLYPPLTHIIRSYLPLWVALPPMWGFGVAAAVTWHVHTPIPAGLIAAGLAWLTVHFFNQFTQPAVD